MTKRVLLVGGGTGGHIYPLIAVARSMLSFDASVEVCLMGDGPLLERAAKESGFKYINIIAPKLRRYASVGNILDIIKVPIALLQSMIQLWLYMPDMVFAKGGYTCVFPVWIARLYRIPVYLHESDAIPGLANRMLAKKSRLIFTSFASSDSYFKTLGRPTVLVGNPFRSELCCVDRALAQSAMKLDPSRKTIFVTGSSSGAQQLNDLILEILVPLLQKGFQVIHQTGDKNFASVRASVDVLMREGEKTFAPLIAAHYRTYPLTLAPSITTAPNFASS